ncbi:MAG: lipocalin family protein [Hydrogeniiclostridium sp.]
MGKFTKRMSAILLAACLLLASACASAPAVSESAGEGVSSAAGENSAAEESKAEESEPEEEEISIDGVWETVGAELDGKELSDEEIEEQGIRTTMVLYPDGTLTLRNQNVNREGTWSESNGNVEMKADGYVTIGEFDGKTLAVTDDTGSEPGTVFFERTGDAPAKSEEGANGGDGNQASDAADIAGTWEVTAVEQDGERLSDEELQDALGGNGMRLEIDADGTFDATLLEDGEEVDTSAGEWTQEGDVFTFVVDGDPETFTLSGNTLVAEDDGITVIFEKK